jgi:secondary thiamine-phosphate synthase enzyme
MRTHRKQCVARATGAPDVVDITGVVEGTLRGSGISQGRLTVLSPSQACSIVLNEKESGLWADVKTTLERLGATSGEDRRALIGSTSVTLPVVNGRLRLGPWQRVLMIELEQPGDRPLSVQIVGE